MGLVLKTQCPILKNLRAFTCTVLADENIEICPRLSN